MLLVMNTVKGMSVSDSWESMIDNLVSIIVIALLFDQPDKCVACIPCL